MVIDSFTHDLTNLAQGRANADLILVVGAPYEQRGIFHTHSIILRARSTYFDELLRRDSAWATRAPGKIFTMEMQMEPTLLVHILNYIYVGLVDWEDENGCAMPALEALNLTIAAHKLGLPALCDKAQEFLILEKFQWLQANVIQILNWVLENEGASRRLKSYVLGLVCGEPQRLFASDGFTAVDRRILLAIVPLDALRLV